MSDDNNETIEQNQNETAATRTRTFTEKGKVYHLYLATEQRKSTYKKWRKQLNKLSALVVDIEDVTQLREERNKLNDLFDELTAKQEKVEEYLTDKDQLDEIEEEYERWDRESVEAFKAVNGKIADLIAYDSETRSSRTCSSTRTRSTTSKKSARHASKHVDNDETIAKRKSEIERLRLLCKLEGAKAELKALQTKQEENLTEMEEDSERDRLEEYLETQMKSVSGEPDNLIAKETYSETPSMKETNENDGISRLADLLTQNQIRDHLPRPEPEIFDGNLLRFPLWMKSFQTLIESRTAVPAERLYYLGRYTIGEAKEVIEGVLPLTTADAYDKAKTLLGERFGNPFLVSNAYRRKINEWPKIQVNDGPGLRKFADFLEACKTAATEIKFLKVLDDPDENQKILQKLPNYIVNGWSRIVDKWIRRESNDIESGAYPPFSEFCKFLQTEARIACNPVTSLRSVKAKDEEKKTFTSRPVKKNTHLTSFATSSNVNAADESTKRTSTSNARKNNCLMCNGNHSIDTCLEFLKLQLTERKKFVTEKRLCWGCLRTGHRSRQCRSKRTCDVCQGPHPSCLHDYSYGGDSQQSSGNPQSDGHFVSNRVRIDHTEQHGPTAMHSLIVPVWLHHVNNPDKAIIVYALLDEQSDACFVRESTLNKLAVNGPKVNIQLSTVLGQKTIESRKVEGLVVKGVKEHAEIKLPKVYSRETIPAKRSQIPRTATALKWPHLQQIAGHLTPYSSELEIGLLLGINCSSAIKPLQVIPGKEDEPYAKKTKLGWGIVGMINKRESNDSEGERKDNEEVIANQTIVREVKFPQEKSVCHFSFQTQVKELIQPSQVLQMFEMDFNSKEKEKGPLSIQDKKFLEIVGEGIRQLPDSHYIMPLPLKTNVQLENNFEMALRRLTHLKRRFETDEKYREDYAAFMQAVIDSGHAEKVNENTSSREDGKVWYIPHHGVYHPHKPGKIRVVFDCSATFKGQSLNKQLIQGPDLANSLIGVICRFRLEPIALMCDIEKMFHQVRVQENCRDLLRFLWWDNADIDSDPQIYRMTVHLFGAVSSPACVNYALKKVADDFQEECGEEAASFIKEDFYVDDGLKSVATVEEAIRLVKDVRTLCSKGGFHLHKFVSNSAEVLQSIPEHERANEVKVMDIDKEVLPIERALGVHWCVESDTIEFRITLKDRPFTRRGILATVSSVFDPLGLVSPVILTGKKILQALCQQSVGWDEKVPDDIRPRWEKWRAELHSLSTLKVNRCVKPEAFATLKSAEMHHFSDASTDGYGQCSYLRLTDNNDKVHCTLTMAKSRVTPLKPITIPRLELSAALVSARISQLLQQEMRKLSLIDVFWTDSKIALGYINNEAKRFHVFVSNRVQQIRDVSTPEQWHYVTSAENPADHASRGLTAKQLVECDKWWNGPKFLLSPSLEYNATEGELMENDPEIKKVQCLSTKTTEFPSFISRLEYFSDWYRAKRAVARILRLQKMFKQRDNSHPKDRVHPFDVPLTVQELQDAEILIVKELQNTHYTELITILSTMSLRNEGAERSYAARRTESLKKITSLHHLDPFLEDGLLRVGGRLKQAEVPHDEKHPLIIPRKSHVTNLILCHFHEKVCHQGRCITQNEVRASGYWITGGKSVISNHISKCVKCRRLRGTLQYQKMADLPKDRLEPSPPFTYSAVDCFGPWVIKEGRKRLKRYGALFTCMASRAIHLEVCNSMDADSFLNAYRRFVGRRGPVRQLRSDQGTNFIGGKNELHKALLEMNDKIHNTLLKDNCDWVVFKPNVPHASHMGGVWERQIKSVRSVLNAVLQSQGDQLDDESLRTLMVEAEAIVNSRPLAVESASSIHISPISPSNLLTMKSKVILSPPGMFDRPDLYSKKRWRRVQYVANEFWFKWRKTYLQSLQQRPKWQATKENVKVDDIVIVKDEGLPRNKWPLARVTEVYTSDDGIVRKVQIAVADSSADDKGRRKAQVTLLQRPIHKLVVLCSAEEE